MVLLTEKVICQFLLFKTKWVQSFRLEVELRDWTWGDHSREQPPEGAQMLLNLKEGTWQLKIISLQLTALKRYIIALISSRKNYHCRYTSAALKFFFNIKQLNFFSFLSLPALKFISRLTLPVLCRGVCGCMPVCIFLSHLQCKVQSLQGPVTSESLMPWEVLIHHS